MVNLINISYDEYIRKYDERKIICIGAGGTFINFRNCHLDKIKLLNNVRFVLDNNVLLKGKKFNLLNNNVVVDYLPEFNESISKNDWILIILVGDAYILDVIKQLDEMPIFEGFDCIYGIGTFRWGYTYFPAPKYKMELQTRRKERIPRLIHYCWFGPNDIPEKDLKCISSFSEYNPDYEVVKWSEDNFDISNAPKYVQDAYNYKKYAFVSDYVRLWAVYKYGGIYLDTDVELFSNLDFILGYRMMFAYMEYGELATGLGFASEKGTAEIKEMMDIYNTIPFVLENDNLNLTPCPRYTNDYFRRKGIALDNSLEIFDDIVFLPSDYLCPMQPVECSDGSHQLAQLSLTERSIGIHWCNNTWKSSKELSIFDEVKQDRELINKRILSDWKRNKGL